GGRRLEPRRVITVFGCGGDRDRAKRPVMGRIAVELSDWTIVTSDNPRSEDPRAIVAEILAGARERDPQGTRHVADVDRARAIARAVEIAEPGDIVLIAGKGHEPYQLIAGKRFDFDDRLVARAAVEKRLREQPARKYRRPPGRLAARRAALFAPAATRPPAGAPELVPRRSSRG